MLNRCVLKILVLVVLIWNSGCTSSSNSSSKASSSIADLKWHKIASKPSNQFPSDLLSLTRGATFANGKKILSWGDIVSGRASNSGEFYDTESDTWTSISSTNAPTGRSLFTSALSDTELIVWGGRNEVGDFVFNDGGVYNLSTNSWSSISIVNAPTARFSAGSVWTGSQLIVWGGQQDFTSVTFTDGAVYTRATDSWATMNTINAPTSRRYFSSVWTGTEMIVWGGAEFPSCASCNHPSALNSGAKFNPSTNTWSTMSTVGAPSPRAGHLAVWTGSRMIVWGGGDLWESTFLNDGAIYDPSTDTWSPISSTNAPSGRRMAGSVWNGSQLIVFGGQDYTNDCLNTGATYDPITDLWETLPTDQAPTARYNPMLVWINSSLYVLGGNPSASGSTDTGGRLGKDDLPSSSNTFTPNISAPLASTWTSSALSQNILWSAVAAGNGKFVAVSSASPPGASGGSSIAAISIDGISWTQTSMPVPALWDNITFGNGSFVAISTDGQTATSTDGIIWASGSLSASNYWRSVTFGNGLFVAVAGAGSPGDGIAATSADGITWTPHAIPDGQWFSVTYGNGIFLAIGGGPNSAGALTSPDGVTWTQHGMPHSDWWNTVTYGNGIFLAMTFAGTLAATSSDGINWTRRSMSSLQDWSAVVFGNGFFVAVASDSNVAAVSTDGITWLQKSLPAKAPWISLCYGSGKFLAISGAGSAGGGATATTSEP